MKQLIIATKATLVLTILTGVAYPLLVTGLNQLLFSHHCQWEPGGGQRQLSRSAASGGT